MQSRDVIGFVTIALQILGCSDKAPSDLPVTLCEIRSRQADFDQKRVVVRVNIEGDGERTVISDAACPALGAQLQFSEIAATSGDVEAVSKAVMDKVFGKSVAVITATLSGTFIIDNSNGTVAILVVDDVSDLDIEETSPR